MGCVDHVWSLELLAGVAYVKTIWEKPVITTKLIEVCDAQVPGSQFDKGEFAAVSNMVIDEVYEKILPELVSVNAVHIAKKMGFNIYNWANYLLKIYKLKINSADAIQWTSVGTINVVKVFQNWLSKPKVLKPKAGVVLLIACRCAQVEFIQKKSLKIQKFLETFNVPRENEIKYLTFMRKTLEYFQKDQIADPVGKPVELFNLAVELGFYDAAKFYWNEMDVIEQEANIIPNATSCVEKSFDTSYKEYQPFQKHKEILMFLISKMSENIRRNFFRDMKFKILAITLMVWPAQKLFRLYLAEMKDALNNADYFFVLIKILTELEKDMYWDKRLNPTNNIYYPIFQIVWLCFSDSLQQELVIPQNPQGQGLAHGPALGMLLENLGVPIPNVHNLPNHQRSQPLTIVHVVHQLLNMFHLPGLKLVLNDKNVKNIKDQLINKNLVVFEEVVENEKFEALDLFMHEIFDSDEKKKNFKLKLNFYYELIIKSKFDVAEKFLNWQFDSNGNRKELIMNVINPKKICETFIGKCEYEKAENFLNWVFETDDEKENFKNQFRSDDFVVKTVYGLWAKHGTFYGEHEINQESKAENTLKFLRWVFKNEDKVNQYKTEKLITGYKSVEYFFTTIMGKVKAFQKFLSFCELPEDKIKQVKKELFENINDVARSGFKDTLRMFHFGELDYLFSWSADSDEQKKMAIKNFLNLVGVTYVWRSLTFYCKVNREEPDDRVRFFNEWVKGSPDLVFQMKNHLYSVNRKKMPGFFPVIKNICGKLEKGEDLHFNDLFVSGPNNGEQCIMDYYFIVLNNR